MKRVVETRLGYTFHLSLENGVCCIVCYDCFTSSVYVRYCTNYKQALDFLTTLP